MDLLKSSRLAVFDLRHTAESMLGVAAGDGLSAFKSDLGGTAYQGTVCVLVTNQLALPIVFRELYEAGYTNIPMPYQICISAEAVTLENAFVASPWGVHPLLQQHKREGRPTDLRVACIVMATHSSCPPPASMLPQKKESLWAGRRYASLLHSLGFFVLLTLICFICRNSKLDVDCYNPAPGASTRQPTSFTFNFSRDWSYGSEYPLEAAIANFLYWHTGAEDTVVSYPGKGDDIFGLVSLFMKRKLVSFVEVSLHDKLSASYQTMELLVHVKNDCFWGGYANWPKMMVCVSFARNAFQHGVGALAFLYAQTETPRPRILRDRTFWSQLEVHQHIL